MNSWKLPMGPAWLAPVLAAALLSITPVSVSPVAGSSSTPTWNARSLGQTKCVTKKVHGKKKHVCRRVHATATPVPTPDEATYYLSLGDSVPSGFQPGGGRTTAGMADLFFEALKSHGVQGMLNLACPGEDSASFMNSCPFARLGAGRYNGFPTSGSQLGAALAFIRDHPGRVRYVTINLGYNDIQETVVTNGICTVDTRIAQELTTFDTNFTSILSQLQSAVGTAGTVIVLNNFDAYLNICAGYPEEAAEIQSLNAHTANDAAEFHMRVADVFGAFGGNTTPNPKLCVLTHICDTPPDSHPTLAGHAVIATALSAAAGLQIRRQ